MMCLPLFALADDVEIEPKDMAPAVSGVKEFLKDPEQERALAPETADVVEAGDDGSIKVTSNGMAFKVTPPFGWYGIGQDVFAQYDVYSMISDDANALAQALIDSGVSLLAFDMSFQFEVQTSVAEDGVSRFVRDMNEYAAAGMSDKVVGALQKAMSDCTVSAAELGGNTWLVYDSGEGVLIYSFVTGGKSVDFRISRYGDLYGGFFFSPGYTDFLNRMAAVASGEPLTEWSGMRSIQEETEPEEAARFSVQMTPEQAANFASARLIAYQKEYDDYLFIYETDDVSLSEEGTLSAAYNREGLYVVSGDGETVHGPISYDKIGDFYVINFNEYPEDDPFRARRLLLYAALAEDGKTLNVVGCREYNFDTEMLGGKVDFEQRPGYYFVNLNFWYTPTYSEDGLLPHSEWTGGAVSGWYTEKGDLDWSMQFRNMDIGTDTCILFEVTDTQGNTYTTDMIPLQSGYVQEADVADRVIAEDDNMRVTVTASRLNTFEDNGRVVWEIQVTNKSRYDIDYFGFENVMVDTTQMSVGRAWDSFEHEFHSGYTSSLAAGESVEMGEAVLFDTLNECGKTGFDALEFDVVYRLMNGTDEIMGETMTLRAHIDQHVRLPAEAVTEREPALASCTRDGVTYEIRKITMDTNYGTLRARLHIVNDTAEDVLLPLDEGVWRLNGAFEPDGYYACDQSCLLPTGYDVFTQVTFNYCDRAVKAFALSEIDGFDWTVEDGTVSLALRESFDVSPWVPEKGRVRLMSGAGLSVYAVDVKRTQYGGNYIYAAVCNDSNESLSYKITWAGCNGGTFEWPDNVSGELAPGCGKMVEFYGFEIENEEDIESIGLEAYVWQTEDELPAKYAMTLTLAAPLSYNGEEDVTADLGAATVETALLEQVRNVYVTFGACEQDGVAENGAEPIEWRVLTTDGETAPLLSRDILAARPFQAVDTSWENSTLKPWLNGEFLETAFTGEEQAKLAERDGCRVTLLTAEEAEMYFADDEARRCLPTQYALDGGAMDSSEPWTLDELYMSEGAYTGWWWLRNAHSDTVIESVDYDGSVQAMSYGNIFSCGYALVRPCVHAALDEDCAMGDIVTLGAYPQNGPQAEPIEWIVLAKDEGESLLLARRGLTAEPFTDGEKRVRNVRWADCSLRAWLNGDFLNDAFDEDERATLVGCYRDHPEDLVTLLDADEGMDYFYWAFTDAQGRCVDALAEASDAVKMTEDVSNDYWLRTDPETAEGYWGGMADWMDAAFFATRVMDGDYFPLRMGFTDGVRPMIRVNIEAAGLTDQIAP